MLYNKKYSARVSGARGYAGFRNRLRIKRFLGLINPKPGERILEIGCNDGGLLSALKEREAEVFGVDVNEDALSRIPDLDVRVASAENTGFPSGTFHKICAFEVLEHVPDVQAALREVSRLLVPHGKCYLSVPYEIIRGEQALGDAIFAYGDIRKARSLHLHKLTPKKIMRLTEGLPLKKVFSGLWFIPAPSFVLVLEKT
ncbi:MAG: class I SAM-dependent methyltransferase [Patescibacteria group bacterium]